jgi:hypothetical protein
MHRQYINQNSNLYIDKPPGNGRVGKSFTFKSLGPRSNLGNRKFKIIKKYIFANNHFFTFEMVAKTQKTNKKVKMSEKI